MNINVDYIILGYVISLAVSVLTCMFFVKKFSRDIMKQRKESYEKNSRESKQE